MYRPGVRTSLAIAAAVLALHGCTAEGTHAPKAELSSITQPDGTVITTAAAIAPGASQAFAGEEETKVEASVNALARPQPASKRIAAKRSQLIELPGVRKAKSIIALAPATGASLRNKASALSKPVRVASAAALARIGKHGLRTQHSKVSVGCLKPELVRLIKKAERHFGRHAVVTSGYRSPRHNRRIGGARKSMHVSCQAADIQIKGVTKWKLASWLRQQGDRGGVGTYCHTQSVHIDTGKRRDWNWRCKRRRGKRRRA